MTHSCSPDSTSYPYCSSRNSLCQWVFVELSELCRYAQNNRGDIVFYDKFMYLCKQKGVAPSRAATDAGISRSLVTKWRTTNIKTPSPEVLEKLSKYFCVPISELLSEEEQKNPPSELVLTERESRILEALRSKTPAERKALLTLLGISED